MSTLYFSRTKHFFASLCLFLAIIGQENNGYSQEDQSIIKTDKHIIDLDANPFTPDSLSIESHTKGGLWEFDPSKILLYISKKQIKGNISDYDLREELKFKQKT